MKRRSPFVLVALCVALALPASGAEVHPFYEQRLTAGVLALSQGAAAVAASELRLAAFGLLDDPPRLVVALALLALAEHATGDGAGRDETLQRLLTVEQRFSVWASADLSADSRSEVESLLAETVPEAGLAAVPAFRPLATERAERRLAGLPPGERRRELTALVAAQPEAARWQVMLGELELAAGDTTAAVARAQRVLAGQPSGRDQVAARCLRGRALAGSGSCAAAVADLEACPATRSDPEAAKALLECHAQLGQWRQASELVGVLPAGIRSRRDMRRLVNRVERESAGLAAADAAAAPQTAVTAAPTDAPSGETATPPSPANPPAAAPPVAAPGATGLPAADRQRLDNARQLMAQARRVPELEQPLAIAVAVADAHPTAVEAQHLAAEIAYRASRWPLAVTYFRRGGEPTASAELMFYYAVALWESGDSDESTRILDAALPRLPRSPFVDEYVARILGRLR